MLKIESRPCSLYSFVLYHVILGYENNQEVSSVRVLYERAAQDGELKYNYIFGKELFVYKNNPLILEVCEDAPPGVVSIIWNL